MYYEVSARSPWSQDDYKEYGEREKICQIVDFHVYFGCVTNLLFWLGNKHVFLVPFVRLYVFCLCPSWLYVFWLYVFWLYALWLCAFQTLVKHMYLGVSQETQLV